MRHMSIETEQMVREAWLRCGGHCECGDASHGHPVRCGRGLVWSHRGLAPRRGAWQARLGEGSPSCPGVEVLCWECYLQVVHPLNIPLARAA